MRRTSGSKELSCKPCPSSTLRRRLFLSGPKDCFAGGDPRIELPRCENDVVGICPEQSAECESDEHPSAAESLPQSD
eukprot:3613096-Rhodomonas_salina.2